MIGYCANGYKLWSPEDKRIILGRGVKFDDTLFELPDKDEWMSIIQEQREDPLKDFLEEQPLSEEYESCEEIEEVDTESLENQNREVRTSSRVRKEPASMNDYIKSENY